MSRSDHSCRLDFDAASGSRFHQPKGRAGAFWLSRIWASPNSLLGLVIGLVGVPWGVRWQLRNGCIELHGGLVRWLLRIALPPAGASAMTLGHVIWGQSEQHLDAARKHEHVHVRQYERWGPFFIPAYLVASLILWLRGRAAYRENPFEVEAYRRAPLAAPSENDE